MSIGRELEKNFSEFIKDLIEVSYWPSRSGLQSGYDAYAKFNIDEMDYWWKFELKALNGTKHRCDFNYIDEIEIRHFSDKIMQLMARADRDTFPYVFCIVMPHKRIGHNTQLRDDLKNWNIFNKFPFKILLWDFDFFAARLAVHHPSWLKTFYPNAPASFDGKSAHTEHLVAEIRRESQEGCLCNRSYIRAREIKSSVAYDRGLHIRIEGPHPTTNDIVFNIEGSSAHCSFQKLEALCVKRLPQSDAIADKRKTRVAPPIGPSEGSKPSDVKLGHTESSYDQKDHDKDVKKKKSGLIDLLKSLKPTSKSLYNHIKAFCKAHPDGCVTFIMKKDVTLARVPFKELHSSDFEEKNIIDFCIEYIRDE